MKTMIKKTDRTGARGRNAVDMLRYKLGPIRYRKLAELRSYSRTLRKMPEKQIVMMMANLREFGFCAPVAVDGDGTIITGEVRVEAARRIGMVEVPTLDIEHLSPAQVRALRVAESKIAELGSWDMPALALEIEEILSISDIAVEALGFDTAEIDLLLTCQDISGDADPADDLPEIPFDPVSRADDIWIAGGHRLLCASSLEAMSWARLLAGATGSMGFTDAPYNLPVQGHVSGLGKTRHAEFAMASGEMSVAEFVTFNEIYLRHMMANMADGSVLFACMDWKHLLELLTAARSVGLHHINTCVWNKTNGGMGSLYRSKHEMIPVFKKGRAPHTNNVNLGASGRYRTNVWDYAGANSFGASRMADLKDHPTVKPTALVADAIRDVSRRGEIVLDAFMGSGTTMLAAERTGRRAYGIEIEPGYVDVALRRWSAMAGSEPILEATGERFSEVRDRRLEEASASPAINPPPRRRIA